MMRAAVLAALLIAGSARSVGAEPVAPEIITLEDEPQQEKVVLDGDPAVGRAAFEDVTPAEEFRLDDIVNPYVGYQVPVVDQIVNPYRDGGFRAEAPPQSYAELCRRYCQDPQRSLSRASSVKYVPPSRSSLERERLFEQRTSNADLRLMGGLVLAGTALGALALIAGDPSFENDLGFMGSGLLIGGGLVVGLALVTTGDEVELRFARNQVARAR